MYARQTGPAGVNALRSGSTRYAAKNWRTCWPMGRASTRLSDADAAPGPGRRRGAPCGHCGCLSPSCRTSPAGNDRAVSAGLAEPAAGAHSRFQNDRPWKRGFSLLNGQLRQPTFVELHAPADGEDTDLDPELRDDAAQHAGQVGRDVPVQAGRARPLQDVAAAREHGRLRSPSS